MRAPLPVYLLQTIFGFEGLEFLEKSLFPELQKCWRVVGNVLLTLRAVLSHLHLIINLKLLLIMFHAFHQCLLSVKSLLLSCTHQVYLTELLHINFLTCDSSCNLEFVICLFGYMETGHVVTYCTMILSWFCPWLLLWLYVPLTQLYMFWQTIFFLPSYTYCCFIHGLSAICDPFIWNILEPGRFRLQDLF